MTTRTNYIFVDFENTQDIDLDLIADKPVKIVLVLGGKQERLPVALVKKLLKYAAQIEVIETEQTGNHALDFVLACEIGVKSVADPGGFFHILSRDKGFDAVIRHLKERKIFGARHEEFAKIPVLVEVKALTSEERLENLRARFTNPKTTRPARLKTLQSSINAIFKKQLSAEDIQATVDALAKAKVLSVSPDGKVSYQVPTVEL